MIKSIRVLAPFSFAGILTVLVISCSGNLERTVPIKGDMAQAKEVALRVFDDNLFVFIKNEIPQIKDSVLTTLRMRHASLKHPVIRNSDTMTACIEISMRSTGKKEIDAKIFEYLEKRINEAVASRSLPFVPTSSQQFTVLFGILKESENGKFKMYKKTDSIPLIAKPEKFFHGFIIAPLLKEDFEISAKIYMPETTKKFKGVSFDGMKQDMPKELLTEGIDYPKFKMNRDAYLALQFDKGDPTGEWRMVLFLNDKVAADVTYQVYAPTKLQSEAMLKTIAAEIESEKASTNSDSVKTKQASAPPDGSPKQ